MILCTRKRLLCRFGCQGSELAGPCYSVPSCCSFSFLTLLKCLRSVVVSWCCKAFLGFFFERSFSVYFNWVFVFFLTGLFLSGSALRLPLES